MGAHHYKVDVIPHSLDSALDAERLEAGDHWGEEQPPESLLDELRNLLPRNTSWGGCEEFESSNAWGSDIRIWHEDDISSPVFGVNLRFAIGADGIELLQTFLTSVRKHGLLVFAVQSKRVLNPDFKEVLEDYRQSTAFKFLSDPSGAIVEAASIIDSGNT